MAAQNRHGLELLRRGNIRQPLEPLASYDRNGGIGAGPQGFSLPLERDVVIDRAHRVLVHRWRGTAHYRARGSCASVDLDAAAFAGGVRLVVGTGKTPSPALDSRAARRNRHRTQTGEGSSTTTEPDSGVNAGAVAFPGSVTKNLVESRGVEPLTFSLRTRRSTN